MPRQMENVVEFRASGKHHAALWSIGEFQAYGNLIFHSDRPVLRITLEVDEEESHDFRKSDHPILKATEPPIQAKIVGNVQKYGTITLENCARYNIHSTHNYFTRRAVLELDFLPTAVWIGGARDSVDGEVATVIACDARLGGFFGSPGLEHHQPYQDATKEVFRALNYPESIWALHGPHHHGIQLGSTGWALSVYTTLLETYSATEGHISRSMTNIALHPPGPTNIEEASKYVSRIEEIISTFSIEPFSFQFEQYDGQGLNKLSLVWRLGENRDLFTSPMRHQILIDLTDLRTLTEVCSQWFMASSTVGLSRWLFVRALRETEDGLARFIAVAQAFEVLGRELGPANTMTRGQLRCAVDAIKHALSGQFDSTFIDRVAALVQSSNRASYRDVLHHMLRNTIQQLQTSTDGDIERFCALVADTRNAVVHMTNNDKGKLNEAFSRVNKLSLQLCFWYAVCQATQMKIKIPDIATFLFNNRNARHGLPNEILENAD